MERLPLSWSYALHPVLPQKLGFRMLLKATNPELHRLLRDTDRYTLQSGRNRTTLFREGKRILEAGIPGEFVEIGVHTGGSAGVLAHLLRDSPDRNLHLFDRWGDLPEPTIEDGARQLQYAKANIPDKLARLRNEPPLEKARKLLEGRLRFPPQRIQYYQGWYRDTLKTFGGTRIAFASIDCDYYESVKLSLEFVQQFVVCGTTLVVDDYGTWPGAKQATDEWIDAHAGSVDMIHTGLGPAILRVVDPQRLIRSAA